MFTILSKINFILWGSCSISIQQPDIYIESLAGISISNLHPNSIVQLTHIIVSPTPHPPLPFTVLLPHFFLFLTGSWHPIQDILRFPHLHHHPEAFSKSHQKEARSHWNRVKSHWNRVKSLRNGVKSLWPRKTANGHRKQLNK